MLKKSLAILSVALGIGMAVSSVHARTASATAPLWKDARQISAADLAARVSSSAKDRALIVQVGFRVLYDGGHIPGAIFAGPASTPEGSARLRKTMQSIPRGREVILYCGCCPWEKCPNVRPAYEQLRKMGFSKIVVLLIPQDFAHDWVAHGYPVARSK